MMLAYKLGLVFCLCGSLSIAKRLHPHPLQAVPKLSAVAQSNASNASITKRLHSSQPEAVPILTEVDQCGGAHIAKVGSFLQSGQDGSAWKVTLADAGQAIIKVARDTKKAKRNLVKECNFAKQLALEGVERTVRCLGTCTSNGSPAAVFSPFVQDAEDSPMMIQLGDNTEHAVREMLKTAWQMLHGGFVNLDQANNVLYARDTGNPVFIDFGRAIRVTNQTQTTKMRMPLVFHVKAMLKNLVDTVPRDLSCGLAQREVAKLQRDAPPSKPLQAAVCDYLQTEFPKKCGDNQNTIEMPNC